MRTFPSLLCIAYLLAASFALAQETWHFQNPIPTPATLTSVCFVDPDNGWAAGEYGAIIRTTNGGASWDICQAADSIAISKVFFADSKTGWGIGLANRGGSQRGYVLHTTDGGLHWADQLGFEGDASSIFFADTERGWMGRRSVPDGNTSTILKTTDGGETWFAPENATHGIASFFFVDALTGWAVGGGSSAFEATILKTTDGGENWLTQSAGVNGELGSVFFVNKDTGWAVGTDNTILKTTNGGMDWLRQPIGGTYCQLTSVHFTDAQNGFVAGWSIFLTTRDGGDNWVVERYPPHNALAVCFVGSDVGWRVGCRGSIQKSTDGGATWIYQSKTFSEDNFRSVDFVDRDVGWIIGETSIFHTSDGGLNWQQQYSRPFGPGLTQLCFVNGMSGWAVGGDATGTPALMLHTSDAGNSWERQTVEVEEYLNAVCFTDERTGWAVGDSGTVVYTTDGGVHWSQQSVEASEHLTSVDFVSASSGWIAGDGVLLRTTNAGAQWDRYTLDGFFAPSIDFVDTLVGWAGWWRVKGGWFPSAWACIWHTEDGGKSWTCQFEDYGSITSVKFVNATVGWATGSALMFTDDGGQHWVRRSVPCGPANSVDFAGPDLGWLVGSGGTILHTSDRGVSFAEEATSRQPSRSLLYQNYPNPFNPSTTITYALPTRSHVTMSVFNTLGQLVNEPVNGEIEAGYHTVQFDAKGLASGVYLYRMTAGSFVETRKLLLLR